MKRKEEQVLTLADGREGVRRFRTDYWTDGRQKKPTEHTRGFPRAEDGSIDGVFKLVGKGYISKGACYDRVTGRYLWTVKRGEKVPGTRLYMPIISKGEA